jgi:hypothetical protein
MPQMILSVRSGRHHCDGRLPLQILFSNATPLSPNEQRLRTDKREREVATRAHGA